MRGGEISACRHLLWDKWEAPCSPLTQGLRLDSGTSMALEQLPKLQALPFPLTAPGAPWGSPHLSPLTLTYWAAWHKHARRCGQVYTSPNWLWFKMLGDNASIDPKFNPLHPICNRVENIQVFLSPLNHFSPIILNSRWDTSQIWKLLSCERGKKKVTMLCFKEKPTRFFFLLQTSKKYFYFLQPTW